MRRIGAELRREDVENPNEPQGAEFNGRGVEQTSCPWSASDITYLINYVVPRDVFRSIFSFLSVECVPIWSRVSEKFCFEAYNYLEYTLHANYNCGNVLEPFNREILPVDFSNVPSTFRAYFLYAVRHWKNDVICKEYLKAVLLCIERGIDIMTVFGRDEINGLVSKNDKNRNVLSWFLTEFISRSQNTDLPLDLKEFLESKELKEEFGLNCLFESNIDLWAVINLWKEHGCKWTSKEIEGTDKQIYKFTIVENANDYMIAEQVTNNKQGLLVGQNNTGVRSIILELNESNDEAVLAIGRFMERLVLNNKSPYDTEWWRVIEFFARHSRDKFRDIVSKIILHFYYFPILFSNYKGMIISILTEFVEENLIGSAQILSLKEAMLRKDLSNNKLSLHEWEDNFEILSLLNMLLAKNLIKINNGEEILYKEIIINFFKIYKVIWENYPGPIKYIAILLEQLLSKDLIEINQDEEYLLKNSLFDMLRDYDDTNYESWDGCIFCINVLLKYEKIKINNNDKAVLKTFLINALTADKLKSSLYIDCVNLLLTLAANKSVTIEKSEANSLKDRLIGIFEKGKKVRLYSSALDLLCYLVQNNLVSLEGEEICKIMNTSVEIKGGYLLILKDHLFSKLRPKDLDLALYAANINNIITAMTYFSRLANELSKVEDKDVIIMKNCSIAMLSQPDFPCIFKHVAANCFTTLILENYVEIDNKDIDAVVLKDCVIAMIKGLPEILGFTWSEPLILMGLLLEHKLLDLDEHASDIAFFKDYAKSLNGGIVSLLALSFIMEKEELFKLISSEILENTYNNCINRGVKYSKSRTATYIKFYSLFLTHDNPKIRELAAKLIELIQKPFLDETALTQQ